MNRKFLVLMCLVAFSCAAADAGVVKMARKAAKGAPHATQGIARALWKLAY